MPVRSFLLGGSLILGGAVLGGPLGGRQVFPLSNWWNHDISQAPVDREFGRLRLVHRSHAHGCTPTSVPRRTAFPTSSSTGDQPLVQPTWTAYGDESDNGAPGRPPGYPIPPEAKTQPNYIEGAVAGGGTSGDRHLLIVDHGQLAAL